MEKAVKAYESWCPDTVAATGKRGKKPFHVLKYVEQVKQETGVIKDGVFEMQSRLHFIYFMGKPKNGSMDPVAAGTLWDAKRREPGAIVDNLGLNPLDKDRIAIRKTDLIKLRDSHMRGSAYELHDKDVNNPD